MKIQLFVESEDLYNHRYIWRNWYISIDETKVILKNTETEKGTEITKVYYLSSIPMYEICDEIIAYITDYLKVTEDQKIVNVTWD